MNRRKFLTTAGLLIAAPAIVRAEWIMPVKKIANAQAITWVFPSREGELVMSATDDFILRAVSDKDGSFVITGLGQNVIIENDVVYINRQ